MFWRSRGFGKGWVMLECTYYLNGKEFWIFAYSLLLGWNCMAQFSILSWSPICLPKHSIKLQCISVRRWGDISRPSTYPSRPEHEAFSKQNQTSLT